MRYIPWSKIAEAVEIVQKGITKRVDVGGNIAVYQCGTVIRIDVPSRYNLYRTVL